MKSLKMKLFIPSVSALVARTLLFLRRLEASALVKLRDRESETDKSGSAPATETKELAFEFGEETGR